MQKFDPHKFWKDPSQASKEIRSYMEGRLFKWAQPKFYLDKIKYSGIIIGAMDKYAQKDWSILEVGSGTGRNLADLIKHGYTNVRGIEINQRAIDLGVETFPELEGVEMVCGTLEDTIKDTPAADVIFSRGCLMHLPYESDWVWKVLAAKAVKMIVTSDDEENEFEQMHKYARNYKEIFEKLGFLEVEMETCEIYPPLPASTIKRVFLRVDSQKEEPVKISPAKKKGKSRKVRT